MVVNSRLINEWIRCQLAIRRQWLFALSDEKKRVARYKLAAPVAQSGGCEWTLNEIQVDHQASARSAHFPISTYILVSSRRASPIKRAHDERVALDPLQAHDALSQQAIKVILRARPPPRKRRSNPDQRARPRAHLLYTRYSSLWHLHLSAQFMYSLNIEWPKHMLIILF